MEYENNISILLILLEDPMTLCYNFGELTDRYEVSCQEKNQDKKRIRKKENQDKKRIRKIIISRDFFFSFIFILLFIFSTLVLSSKRYHKQLRNKYTVAYLVNDYGGTVSGSIINFTVFEGSSI